MSPTRDDFEVVKSVALRTPAGLPDELRVSARCERLAPLHWRAEVRVEGPGGRRGAAANEAPGPEGALRLAFETALRALAQRGAA